MKRPSEPRKASATDASSSGFAAKVSEGLDRLERVGQRKLIRALVKRIDVDNGEIEIIFRVPPPDAPAGPGHPPEIDRAANNVQPSHNKFYSTYREFAEAALEFLRKKVPGEWSQFRNSVTDNFRVIDPKNFRVLA